MVEVSTGTTLKEASKLDPFLTAVGLCITYSSPRSNCQSSVSHISYSVYVKKSVEYIQKNGDKLGYHVNAPAHTTLWNYLTVYGQEQNGCCPPLPYSLDLVVYDIFLLSKIKLKCKGKRCTCILEFSNIHSGCLMI
jgi:hypothetical protein